MPKKRPGVRKTNNGRWEVNTEYIFNGVEYKIHIRGFKSENEAYLAKKN